MLVSEKNQNNILIKIYLVNSINDILKFNSEVA